MGGRAYIGAEVSVSIQTACGILFLTVFAVPNVRRKVLLFHSPGPRTPASSFLKICGRCQRKKPLVLWSDSDKVGFAFLGCKFCSSGGCSWFDHSGRLRLLTKTAAGGVCELMTTHAHWWNCAGTRGGLYADVLRFRQVRAVLEPRRFDHPFF